MAKRFSATGGNPTGAPPSWLEDYLFAPTSGYGYDKNEAARRGGEMQAQLIDPLGKGREIIHGSSVSVHSTSCNMEIAGLASYMAPSEA